LEFAFGVALAKVNRRTDSASVCVVSERSRTVDIDDHQRTSFGATGGVEANSKQSAIAIVLESFVKQKLVVKLSIS